MLNTRTVLLFLVALGSIVVGSKTSLSFAGAPVPPVTAIQCVSDDCTTTVTWQLPITYDSLRVFRDSVEIATLAGDAVEFIDSDNAFGSPSYDVVGRFGGRRLRPPRLVPAPLLAALYPSRTEW